METWIKKIEPTLREALGIPRYGATPFFDTSAFSKSLATALDLEGLEIATGCAEWKTGTNVSLGLGVDPMIYSLKTPPIQGNLFWITAKRDIAKFSEWILKDNEDHELFVSPDLSSGLYEYILLEALDSLKNVPKYNKLPFQIQEEAAIGDEGNYYCIDVSLKRGEEVLWARLALGEKAYKNLGKFFALEEPSLYDLEEYKDVPLTLTLSVGYTKISQKEWKSVKQGDFVLLDRTYYRPKSQKGIMQLCLNNTSLFQTKCKENQLKILDFTYFTEEDNMDTNDDFDNDFLGDDENDDLQEQPIEEDEQSLPEDEDHPLPEDEFLEEESASNDLTEEEETEEVTEPIEESVIQKTKLADVPITVQVEIKRLKMTLAELQKIRPGQALPLSTGDTNGLVHLTVNGHAVAEGELLELSENVVGVKIHKVHK